MTRRAVIIAVFVVIGQLARKGAFRTFLAQRGSKKGDLSRFIERAVQKEVFAQTVAAVQARNARVPDKDVGRAIDDALHQVRAEMWGNRTPRKRVTKKP